MAIEKIQLFKNHILLDRDEVILIDTGSPSSFHKGGAINFGGKVVSCPTSTVGVSCDYLSKALERPISGLLGMDILGMFSNVVFDYANNVLLLDSDVDESSCFMLDSDVDKDSCFKLDSGNVMGVPYITLNIDGQKARMFLDTGAPVSYISSKFTSGKSSLGTVEDFNPLCGNFTSETYKASVLVKDTNIDMTFGNLPFAFQMAIGLAGIDGIIGYELFSRVKMILSQGNFYII